MWGRAVCEKICGYGKFGKGCDLRKLFSDLEISKDETFEKYLNHYDVLYLDITLFLSTMKQDDTMVEPSPLQKYIGFTEEEVEYLCQKYEKDYWVMRQWYDGYYVGGIHAYNPKSVMESILRNKYSSYWTKTETYEALRDYIDLNFDGLKDAVIDMLGGATCEVDTGSFQNDMTSMKSRDDVLTLLIHLGYLAYNEDDRTVFIPNAEIWQEFRSVVKMAYKVEIDEKGCVCSDKENKLSEREEENHAISSFIRPAPRQACE